MEYRGYEIHRTANMTPCSNWDYGAYRDPENGYEFEGGSPWAVMQAIDFELDAVLINGKFVMLAWGMM